MRRYIVLQYVRPKLPVMRGGGHNYELLSMDPSEREMEVMQLHAP